MNNIVKVLLTQLSMLTMDSQMYMLSKHTNLHVPPIHTHVQATAYSKLLLQLPK